MINLKKKAKRFLLIPEILLQEVCANSIQKLQVQDLKVFCHSLGYLDGNTLFDSQSSVIRAFQEWGLPTCPEISLASTLKETKAFQR